MYCVSENSYRPCEFCKDEATCQIRNVFKEIRDNTNRILARTTLKELIKTKDKSKKLKDKSKIRTDTEKHREDTKEHRATTDNSSV